MIRILFYLAVLTLIAAGFAWLADRPGSVALTWGGYVYSVRPHIALALFVVAFAVVALLLWLLRLLFTLPTRLGRRRMRRRAARGREALTQGMIAVGAGDLRLAKRAAAEAGKYIADEPLTLLLRAQAAQLSGDRPGAEALFATMAARDDTRLLGLRGLHLEARRRGDVEAAHNFAAEAQRSAALPWAGEAVLEYYAARADWPAALASVDANAQKKLIDVDKADRLRAVLKTAIALGLRDGNIDDALELAREALKLAPSLVPAAALAGRLLSRKGQFRPAAKVLETTWRICPHPDLAAAYVDLRPGDSAADRFGRAQMLMRLAPDDPESRLTLARAALDRRDFTGARDIIAPLLAGTGAAAPTVRACLLMADIEEVEHGGAGAEREWLARASRARRDKAWIAGSLVSDRWAPATPDGELDAYVWKAPADRMNPLLSFDAEPPETAPPPPAMIEGAATEARFEPEHERRPAPNPAANGSNVVPLTVGQGAHAGEENGADRSGAPRAFHAAPRGDASVRRRGLYSSPVAPDDPGPEPAES